MQQAYIVDALRSPTGKRAGSLAQVHPMDLGAHVIKALVERNSIAADEYDDVIFGAIDAIGPNAGNLARFCWLGAGMPESVPGVTIDRQCGSSQQAVHFAAQAVMSGSQDVVVAGGVQNMSQIPINTALYAATQLGFPDPWTTAESFRARYGEQQLSQFAAAERIATKWGFTRADMEAYALESNNRALAAIEAGHFAREIVPLGTFAMDETARRSSLEKMASLQPILPDGILTAAISSQMSDAASAVLVCSEAAVKRYGLTPRARIVHMSVRGADPVWMLTAPIPATRHALQKAGLRMSDIDRVEINEAFASVSMAWLKELDYDPSRTNVNGGAIALGHPIGATGTKLMTTLLHELERSGGRYGLQTMCEGGGLANVTIIERL
ncbi:acetyl-CoA C-acetyltransferase [Pseudomonas asiatica]|uniref:acetyl-CoA C-acetyltransferase n=1 Tax=Pseudomonas asiatica TaxID=2219225 RepID=UPI002E7BF57F|nr:acetyl-CoA C-acetyltransferase [Pseudomonas asiatica]MEE1916330.1 acetyl-CoA C-acetyltransferase [Pseudomonas asiatica]